MRNPLNSVLQNRNQNLIARPSRMIRGLEDELERWMWDKSSVSLDDFQNKNFSPFYDLSENESAYTLSFDIPGIKKEDIEVEISGSRLKVSGERKTRTNKTDERYFRAESFTGTFSRTITLPSAIDDENIEAHYRDGVLTIRARKVDKSKARLIEIG